MKALQVGALREREFRLLFTGQAISAFGDRLVPVALAFAVLDLTGSASDLGFVLAAETVPMALFVLAGGVWADRLPRQWVMVASDAVRCASQGLTAALLIAGTARIWQLVVLQAVYGTAQAFFNPAWTGLVPETVSPGRLQEANAILGLSRNLAGILGPAVAGTLVATVGPGEALAVDAATFALSAAFLVRLRLPPRVRAAARSFAGDLRDGWGEFRSRSWVWASVLQFSGFHLFVLGPFFVLGPAVAKAALGGVSAWATILAVAGAGSIAGGVVGLRFWPRHPLRAAFLLSIPWAGQVALVAVKAPVAAIAAAAFVGAAALTIDGILWFTALQAHIPTESISRVSAYDWFGSIVFLPVGQALAGPVAAAVGTRSTLLFAAAFTVASSLAVLAVPGVRNLKAR